MTMKSMKYTECDTIMDGYNPVPPPLPNRCHRMPPARNIYAEPFTTEPNTRWVLLTKKKFGLPQGSTGTTFFFF